MTYPRCPECGIAHRPDPPGRCTTYVLTVKEATTRYVLGHDDLAEFERHIDRALYVEGA